LEENSWTLIQSFLRPKLKITYVEKACLFPWLLMLLKQTTGNNCLVTNKTLFTIHGPYHYLHLKCSVTESSSKLLLLCAAVESEFNSLFIVETFSTVHVKNGECLYCSGRIRSGPNLNALNQIRPSKKNYFIFYF
jgi:hypothetical protein